MIISKKHHFIFVKTRKTAGSSIQAALAQICGSQDLIIGGRKEIDLPFWQHWRTYLIWKTRLLCAGYPVRPIRRLSAKHATIGNVKDVMGASVWTYFKFAFVRNPFDLVVSRFFWDQAKGRHGYGEITPWLIEHYSRQGRWNNDLLHRYTHINGECQMDFIGRYESLNQDFDHICSLLSLGHLELPFKKSGFREKQHYSAFYTQEAVAVVERLFAEDLRVFGYAFEDA